LLVFHVSQRTSNPAVRAVHRIVDGDAVLCLEPIFLVPDIFRCRLHGDLDNGIAQALYLGWLTQIVLLMTQSPDRNGCAALKQAAQKRGDKALDVALHAHAPTRCGAKTYFRPTALRCRG